MKLFDLFGKKTAPLQESRENEEDPELYSGMRVEVTNFDGRLLFGAKLANLQGTRAELYQYTEALLPTEEEPVRVRIRGFSDYERKAVYMEGTISPLPHRIWKVEELTVTKIGNDRAFFRLDTDLEASATSFSGLNAGERACRLLNISVGGARVSSEQQYWEGDKLLLTVKLLEDRDPSIMYCQVLRVIEKEGANTEYGCQFLELTDRKLMLTSGGLGTMGYGLPAAIGAKLGNPQKDVIAVCGDGGIQMTVQELATAVVYELPIIICILNNGYLGNVRQWQEMFYDRRYSSTCMRYRRSCETGCNTPNHCCPEYTPDFIALAESYGAKGIRVTQPEDIKTALISAKQNTKTPTVIEFIIDREINVMPIVPPGNSLNDMILESEESTE